jgi:hypothetical protein
MLNMLPTLHMFFSVYTRHISNVKRAWLINKARNLKGNGNQGTKLHYLHNRHAPARFGFCEFNLDLSLPAFLGPVSTYCTFIPHLRTAHYWLCFAWLSNYFGTLQRAIQLQVCGLRSDAFRGRRQNAESVDRIFVPRWHSGDRTCSASEVQVRVHYNFLSLGLHLWSIYYESRLSIEGLTLRRVGVCVLIQRRLT